MLANSLWPRAGVDKGNRSQVAAAGPRAGSIERVVRLPDGPQPRPERIESCGGIALAPDGTLRVARAGLLVSLSLEGDLLWSHVLREGMNIPEYHSAPVVLDNGHTIFTLARLYTVIDAAGKLRRQTVWEPFDDSGIAPNLSLDGNLIATGIGGEVAISDGIDWNTLGDFGYDIVPPAVYDDGSLAVCGYSAAGFCRVDTEGQIMWQTDFESADLTPSINRLQVAAVSSLNQEVTRLYSPDGKQMGEYGLASVLAEYSDEDWIARSENYIARLAPDGATIWEEVILSSTRWGRLQPIVDSEGLIYVADAEGVRCLNGDGESVFTVELDTTPTALAIVAPGVAVCLVDREVVIIS